MFLTVNASEEKQTQASYSNGLFFGQGCSEHESEQVIQVLLLPCCFQLFGSYQLSKNTKPRQSPASCL